MSCEHYAGKCHTMKTGNKSFGSVKQFRYLGTTLTNQNSIHEKIKNRLNSGERLLPFGAESFVFQLAIQKYKD
jgi:hypothetical protein